MTIIYNNAEKNGIQVKRAYQNGDSVSVKSRVGVFSFFFLTDKDFTFFVPVSPAPDLECIAGLGLDLGLESSAGSGCIQRTARCTASTQDRAPQSEG